MINSLQSIRYLLALMIFVHHFVLPPYNPFGDFPVAFFFILSGYVMTLGYQEKILSQDFSYKKFLCKRIKKVYPLHFIMMVIALMPILISAIIHFNTSGLKSLLYSIPAFLLIQSWIPDLTYTYAGNSVSWFLSSMLFCYLLSPYIIRMVKLRTNKVFIFMIIVLTVYFTIILNVSGPNVGHCVYLCPLTRIIDFVLGVSLYQLMTLSSFNSIRRMSKINKTLLEIFALSSIGGAMILGNIVLPLFELASLYWIPSLLVIFVFSIFSNCGGGYVSKLLSNKRMSSMGKYAFPIYMIHYIAIRYYRPFITHYGSEPNKLVWIVLGALIMTLLAYIYVNKVEPIIQKVLL